MRDTAFFNEDCNVDSVMEAANDDGKLENVKLISELVNFAEDAAIFDITTNAGAIDGCTREVVRELIVENTAWVFDKF